MDLVEIELAGKSSEMKEKFIQQLIHDSDSLMKHFARAISNQE